MLCGDLNIRIDRDGVWYYQGRLIQRHELVCLFASVLVRDEEGAFWLVTPAEICRVSVEDAPFLAVEMYVAGRGPNQVISFRTNVDEIVGVDADHALRVETHPETGEPSPYVQLRDGIDARLSRSVYYELVEHGEEREHDGRQVLGVWSSGRFFELGAINAADEPNDDAGTATLE